MAMSLSPSPSVFAPGISCWEAQKVGSLTQGEASEFERILDDMGQLSGQAQGLSSAITTTDKLRVSNDRVYVICDGKGSLVKGFLRLGKKHLFLYPDDGGSMFEEDLLCLLDFYVRDNVQRKGLGFALFDSALKSEGVTPAEIAYDRPSQKLPPFLRKHYGLENGLDQPNRFMVFREHFGGVDGVRSNNRGRLKLLS